MKRFILIFFLSVIAFTSCDGRYRAHESNEKRVSKSNLLADTEIIHYVPEKPIKSITDTIIDSKINVKVTYFSLPNKAVEVLSKPNIKTHYREFESEIQVSKNNQLLFTDILNKHTFNTNDKDFWDDAILQYVWLDEFKSKDDDYTFYCSFLVPESENYKMYSIHFNNSGDKTIELIETS